MPWYSESHTEPFWRWSNAWAEVLFFEEFVVNLAKRADDVVRRAAEALLKYGPQLTPDRAERLERERKVGGGVQITYLQRHASTLAGMIHVRIVDNFLTYVSELIASIFTARPETLKSSEQVRLDFILEHDSMANLIESLVNRRVNELSYRGMSDLCRFLKEHLGFELFPNSEELDVAIEAIERRNLIVHNRGFVSKAAAARVLTLRGLTGRSLDSSVETNSKFGLFFESAVRSIDNRAAEKFRLPTHTLDEGRIASGRTD